MYAQNVGRKGQGTCTYLWITQTQIQIRSIINVVLYKIEEDRIEEWWNKTLRKRRVIAR